MLVCLGPRTDEVRFQAAVQLQHSVRRRNYHRLQNGEQEEDPQRIQVNIFIFSV